MSILEQNNKSCLRISYSPALTLRVERLSVSSVK